MLIIGCYIICWGKVNSVNMWIKGWNWIIKLVMIIVVF